MNSLPCADKMNALAAKLKQIDKLKPQEKDFILDLFLSFLTGIQIGKNIAKNKGNFYK